jgi:murein L,D-transpeptidase YafK
VVVKRTATLTVYRGDAAVASWPVVLGRNPADKQREGDLATPEGEFYICYRNPASRYHRFLGLSYPHRAAADRGLQSGLITAAEHAAITAALAQGKCPPWKTALGGEVGLHGPCPNVTWTHGCVAMTVPQIEQLWNLLALGDRVTILP